MILGFYQRRHEIVRPRRILRAYGGDRPEATLVPRAAHGSERITVLGNEGREP